MYIETREHKIIECDPELEQMIDDIHVRKDSSFYNKDKADYSCLQDKNTRIGSTIM